MPSPALTQWRSSGLGRLAELEAVHATLTGSGPGRRWGTTQLNRSLFVALVAQFQSYCRDLHELAIDVHIAHANPRQRETLRQLLAQARRLDTHNPRRSTLGHDFGRLGLTFIEDLKAAGTRTERNLDVLDHVVDYRNAIGHGDEPMIIAMERSGRIAATKRSYQQHRRALDTLAGTMDAVVADRLGAMLNIPRPW